MRFFVSSTYDDLKSLRENAIILVRQLGHEVDCMEESVAQTPSALQSSKLRISKCNVFIGIYAGLYGTIPPDTDKSLIEHEYNHAQSLPDMAFIIMIVGENWRYLKGHQEPEITEKGSKLTTFINKLLNTHVCARFDNEQEFTARLKSALEFVSGGGRGDHSGVASYLRPWYVRRTALLENVRACCTGDAFVKICGEKGTGRRTLIAGYLNEMKRGRTDWLDCSKGKSPQELFSGITAPGFDITNPGSLCKAVIAAAGDRNGTIVLLDVTYEWIQDFLAPLENAIDVWLHEGSSVAPLIILTTNDTQVIDLISGKNIRVGAMEIKEAAEVVRLYFEKKFLIVDPGGDLAEQVAVNCDRNPGTLLEAADGVALDILVAQFRSGVISSEHCTKSLEVFYKECLRHGNSRTAIEALFEKEAIPGETSSAADVINILREQDNWFWTARQMQWEFFGKRLSGNDVAGRIFRSLIRTASMELLPVVTEAGFTPQPIHEFLAGVEMQRIIRKM